MAKPTDQMLQQVKKSGIIVEGKLMYIWYTAIDPYCTQQVAGKLVLWKRVRRLRKGGRRWKKEGSTRTSISPRSRSRSSSLDQVFSVWFSSDK